MIVKVQISLNDGGAEMLVYSDDRSWFHQGATTPEARAAMGKRRKGFFYAERSNGKIIIGAPAPEQGW